MVISLFWVKIVPRWAPLDMQHSHWYINAMLLVCTKLLQARSKQPYNDTCNQMGTHWSHPTFLMATTVFSLPFTFMHWAGHANPNPAWACNFVACNFRHSVGCM